MKAKNAYRNRRTRQPRTFPPPRLPAERPKTHSSVGRISMQEETAKRGIARHASASIAERQRLLRTLRQGGTFLSSLPVCHPASDESAGCAVPSGCSSVHSGEGVTMFSAAPAAICSMSAQRCLPGCFRKISSNQGRICFDMQETGNGWNWQSALLNVPPAGRSGLRPGYRDESGRVPVLPGRRSEVCLKGRMPTEFLKFPMPARSQTAPQIVVRSPIMDSRARSQAAFRDRPSANCPRLADGKDDGCRRLPARALHRRTKSAKPCRPGSDSFPAMAARLPVRANSALRQERAEFSPKLPPWESGL